MPPTLQILTYCTTGAAFLVGRSAAGALATATMPAAEPSRMLLMSVIVDLQLTRWALVLFSLSSPRPLTNPKPKVVSTLFPITPDVGGLPQQVTPPTRPRPGISRSLVQQYPPRAQAQLLIVSKSPWKRLSSGPCCIKVTICDRGADQQLGVAAIDNAHGQSHHGAKTSLTGREFR